VGYILVGVFAGPHVMTMVWISRPSLCISFASMCFVSGLASSPCMRQLDELSEADKVYLALATGKQLPNDAGKYAMCRGHPHTRYFLVSMNFSAPNGTPSSSLTAKLGFCLPDVCVKGFSCFVGKLIKDASSRP